MRNLKPLSLFVFVFALVCQRIVIKTHSTEERCVIILKNIVFLRRDRASFSPDILQAWAVNGLINHNYVVSVDAQPQQSIRLQCIGWLVKLVQCRVASGEVLAFDCSVVYVVSLGHAEHGLTQRCGCPLNIESECNALIRP